MAGTDWIGLKDFVEWLASTGILGGLIWYLEHKTQRREQIRDKKQEEEKQKDLEERKRRQEEVDRREKERQQKQDERERKHDEMLSTIVDSMDATMELSEATARAVQRIPDAHCNGDMDAALDRVKEVKESKAKCFNRYAIESIRKEEN